MFSIAGLSVTFILFYSHYLKSGGTERQFWLLHWVGIGFFICGEITSFYLEFVRHVIITYPSRVDFLYILLPLTFTMAYLNSLYRTRRLHETVLVILDMLIMDVVIMVVIWQYTILPLFLQIDQSAYSIIVSVSYTMVDTILVLFVLTTLIFFRNQFSFVNFRLVLLGIFIYLSSDILFLIFSSTFPYIAKILNPLWTLSFIMIALSKREPTRKHRSGKIGRYVNKYRLIPPYLSFVILMILMINHLGDLDSLILGVVFASSFMIIRHVLTLTENQRLLNKLRQTNEGLEQVVNKRTGELREALEQIKSLAYFDPLTGLPNRRKFLDFLQKMIDNTNVKDNSFAIFFLDLDRFKIINDTLGHHLGDRLLEIVARRLNQLDNLRMASRLGGDEYVLLFEGQSFHLFIQYAQSILKSISIPFEIDQNELFITTSIGISIYPNDGDTPEQLIKNADAAMYVAKSKGKNSFSFFSKELNRVNNKRLSLEKALHKALEYDELELVYQPQIDVTTSWIIGAEALIRWNHPKEGLIHPNDFIPIANETGLIVPIGEWIIKTACEQAKRWSESSTPIKVAINISPIQLLHKNFVDRVKVILEETGVNPCYLEFEITENLSLHDSDMMEEMLGELIKMGIRVAIDDFGTGYSSLSYLNNFPVTTIKIDRSFISDIHHSNEHFSIVKLIIAMAHTLEKHIVAEGIEIVEQVDMLKRLNCMIMQGYYFSKPVPVDEFEKLLQKNNLLTDRTPKLLGESRF